jgi:hypothetical protein
MELSDYERNAINTIMQNIHDSKWSNEGLVSLLKLIGEDYLQIRRVSRFAKENKMTPQGARKFRKVFEIDGYQFIANNY